MQQGRNRKSFLNGSNDDGHMKTKVYMSSVGREQNNIMLLASKAPSQESKGLWGGLIS